MQIPAPVILSVPATSANLGPGFDILGIALDRRMRFDVTFTEESRTQVLDPSGHEIPGEHNFVRNAWEKARTLRPQAMIPGFSLRFQSDIAPGRGFGSSACALTAGIAIASLCFARAGHAGLSLQEEIDLLAALEGHPDNVCAARLGSFAFGWNRADGHIGFLTLPLPSDLALAALVPNFAISTAQSRKRLPRSVMLDDTVANMTGVLLWLEYVHSGNPELLTQAIHSDKIHEPLRSGAIPAFRALREELPRIGCYGATISGSGPGVLVYYSWKAHESVAGPLEQLVAGLYPDGEMSLVFCRPDPRGLVIGG